MKYVDKGWKRLRDVWKKANVRWHMGAPLKQSPVIVIASVKKEGVWQSVAVGLTGDSHVEKFKADIRKNRKIVKAFKPEQVKCIVEGSLAWLNLNRTVWSVFVGGLMNEETDRYVTKPAQELVDEHDWEKEALDALNFGIAQGYMLLGTSEQYLKSLKPVEPARTEQKQEPALVEPNEAAQFVDGTEIPQFCVVECKKRPSEMNCAHCPFFCNRPVAASHFNAIMYPKGVRSLRFMNNSQWENDVITAERMARAVDLDTYEDTKVAKFCVEGCTKRARADICGKCKYCICAAGAEKEFAAQIRKARMLVK